MQPLGNTRASVRGVGSGWGIGAGGTPMIIKVFPDQCAGFPPQSLHL